MGYFFSPPSNSPNSLKVLDRIFCACVLVWPAVVVQMMEILAGRRRLGWGERITAALVGADVAAGDGRRAGEEWRRRRWWGPAARQATATSPARSGGGGVGGGWRRGGRRPLLRRGVGTAALVGRRNNGGSGAGGGRWRGRRRPLRRRGVEAAAAAK
uniref:Uncharacterized protein n=2 Tax=Oryza sativa subsp. japonica TaxID=39947 RepID=Q8S713_ORYSJ|nr:hypothetical protein [Oryza sativa Japonica Group]